MCVCECVCLRNLPFSSFLTPLPCQTFPLPQYYSTPSLTALPIHTPQPHPLSSIRYALPINTQDAIYTSLLSAAGSTNGARRRDLKVCVSPYVATEGGDGGLRRLLGELTEGWWWGGVGSEEEWSCVGGRKKMELWSGVELDGATREL